MANEMYPTALPSSVVCCFFEIITIRDEAVGCASGRERQNSPAKNVVTRKKRKSNSLRLRIMNFVFRQRVDWPTDRPTDRPTD